MHDFIIYFLIYNKVVITMQPGNMSHCKLNMSPYCMLAYIFGSLLLCSQIDKIRSSLNVQKRLVHEWVPVLIAGRSLQIV